MTIRIALGGATGWTGSAIECRIYAEDPEQQFLPSPGRITDLREPAGPGVRLDSGVYEGWNVPLDYDPLLAKLAAWAPSTGGSYFHRSGHWPPRPPGAHGGSPQVRHP